MKLKKRLTFLAKLTFTTVALYLVFTQANLDEIEEYIKEVSILHLIAALAVINVGQMISSLRMRYYFSSVGVFLTRPFAIALYYMGMFFNLLLPGGIGGDGYKTYYLHKNRDIPWKLSLRIIISGRGNGLFVLVVFTLLMAFASPYVMAVPHTIPLLIAALVIVLPSYSLLAKYLLKEELKTQIRASKYSAGAQIAVVITVILILSGLTEIPIDKVIDYIILFMISSIVSIIPISLAGIGLREMTFFYGAVFLELNPELGVTLSVLYFVVNVIASLFGLISFYRISKIEAFSEGSKGEEYVAAKNSRS